MIHRIATLVLAIALAFALVVIGDLVHKVNKLEKDVDLLKCDLAINGNQDKMTYTDLKAIGNNVGELQLMVFDMRKKQDEYRTLNDILKTMKKE